jgi:hypothetical protein
MQSCNRQGPAPTTANHHSIIEKRFLGVTIPPQALETAAPEGDLRIAPDTLFNHPNVGPFISMQLIQRLVTSNPSPACVARIIGARSRLGVSRQVLFTRSARAVSFPGSRSIRSAVRWANGSA